jgi:acetolactate synthase-1/2/3 large subunit
MWSGALLELDQGQSAHYCGGMGAMGFGLPASIGMSLRTGRRTVNITGDGSVQMNLQELDTLKRLDLDVTVLILNNAALGMVKNFQDMYFGGRNQSTVIGVSQPDFVKVGKAMGIGSRRVSTVKTLNAEIRRSILRRGPCLIDVTMRGGDECRPRLAFGSKLDDQMPKILVRP